MRFATLIVEQLDRAATELAVDHPLNARLALILIDNAAELIIHRRCENLVRADRRSVAPKLTVADRRSILGHHFKEKIKFLEKMTGISDEERHFIAELHAHRNRLYHVGLCDDDIIRPLAVSYFRLTCILLDRFDNKSLGWPKDLVIADTIHRYFPDAARGHPFPSYDAGRVSKLLLERIPEDAPPLPTALAAHSEALVEQMEAKFESIKLGLDKKSTASDTFLRLQRRADFEKLARERIRKNGKEDQFQFIPYGHPVMNKFAEEMMPRWKPRYTSPPFSKWLLRARAIAQESDPLSANRKFTDLHSEMEYLAHAIDAAHEEFWGWVQQQEDAAQDARGQSRQSQSGNIGL
jgi:hypothetical protein